MTTWKVSLFVLCTLILISTAGIAGADEVNAEVNGTDATPPESIINLEETSVGLNWITWTWENPYDIDFSHVMVYIDGAFATNTSDGFYNSTDLTERVHTISTKTVDTAGNINPTWVNDSASTATVNVEFVGSFGGPISDVAVSGDYAYIGQGKNLVVLDMTNVSKPSEVGRLIIPSVVTGVAIAGNYAYVTAGGSIYFDSSLDSNAGLFIVDITDPSTLKFTGNYYIGDSGDSVNDVAIAGNYAYIASGENGLIILDIANSSTPTFAGSYDTAGYAWNVAVVSNYAYIATLEHGLAIVDISDPSEPTLAGGYDTARYVRGVAISGNYAYITGSNDLIIIDITDPSAPTLAGSYNTAGDGYGVAISGNYAYVTLFYSSDYENYSEEYAGFDIMDISNSSSPRLVSRYVTPTGFLSDIIISDNYAYVTAGYIYNYTFLEGTIGLFIVDISNSSTLKLMGRYDAADWAMDVEISDNYAYIADINNDLFIVDVTNPYSPKFISSYATAGPVCEVTVSGNYAYVAAGYGGFVIVDISDPYLPILAGSYACVASDLAIADNYAYIVSDESGLVILDITNPSALKFVGSYDTSDAESVVVLGNYAYVADYWKGLMILDITDPSSPSLVGGYNTAGYAHKVAIEGHYAYIAADEQGLVIVDISDPSSPTRVSNYDTGGEAYDVVVSGNYAYIADSDLVILDISSPLSPTLAGSYDTAGSAWNVAVAGNYAYVADWANGLVIMKVEKTAEKTAGLGLLLALSAIGGVLLLLRRMK